MDKLIVWISKSENIIGLAGNLSSTFLGAGLAFWFGLKLFSYQKKQEHFGYLQFATTSLISTMNRLYSLKGQCVVGRVDEALKAKKIFNYMSDDGAVNLHVRKMSLFIHATYFPWPIAHDRLHFLTKRDPNLIVLLGSAAGSIEQLKSIIFSINKTIENAMAEKGAKDPESILYLTENTILLGENIDSSLYLVKKCISLLNTFGELEYKNKWKIRKVSVSKKYQSLEPAPLEDWEDTEWFPRKKHWYAKFGRNLKGSTLQRILPFIKKSTT